MSLFGWAFLKVDQKKTKKLDSQFFVCHWPLDHVSNFRSSLHLSCDSAGIYDCDVPSWIAVNAAPAVLC